MNGKGVAVILVLMFGLAIAVGVVAAKMTARVHGDGVPTNVRRGTLADELQLDASQNAKMRAIWEEVNKVDWVQKAKAIQDDEDKRLMDGILDSDKQKKQFEDLRNESKRKLDDLEKERKEAFKKAVDESEKLLNDDQRRLYRQIIKDKTGSLPDPAHDGTSEGVNLENIAQASQ